MSDKIITNLKIIVFFSLLLKVLNSSKKKKMVTKKKGCMHMYMDATKYEISSTFKIYETLSL